VSAAPCGDLVLFVFRCKRSGRSFLDAATMISFLCCNTTTTVSNRPSRHS